MSRKRVDELCRDWMVSRYPPNCFTPVERDVLAITKTASLWYESTFHGRHLSLFIGKKISHDVSDACSRPICMLSVGWRPCKTRAPQCPGSLRPHFFCVISKLFWRNKTTLNERRSFVGASPFLFLFSYCQPMSSTALAPDLFIISTRSRAALDIIPV